MKNPKDSLRDKSRLAFELLENEFEVISFDDTFEIKGGTMSTPPIDEWTPDDPYTTTEGPGIVVGPVTPVGIASGMSLGFNGSGMLNSDGGTIQSLGMQTTGSVGFEQNSNGEWVASANFGVISPSGYSNPMGSVDVYVGGNYVGSFGVNQQNNQSYPNGTIGAPNTDYISGSFTLPSNFDGSSSVTFSVSVGSTQDTGGGYQHVSQSGDLTLQLPFI